MARQTVGPLTLWWAPSYTYGTERVPRTGAFVLCANHLSAIDPTLIGVMCPRTIHYMAKAELFEMPIVGHVIDVTGAFPVRRGEVDRETLRYARRLLATGNVVGVFMEGSRQRLGYPGPVHAGGPMLALQEDVPIVPCGVYSFGWTRKNRRPCAVVWGEPMRLEGLPKSGRGYKEGASILAEELVRLWRLAGEAVGAGFPEELEDGARRSGVYEAPISDAARAVSLALRSPDGRSTISSSSSSETNARA